MKFGSTLAAAATLVVACAAADLDPIVIKVRLVPPRHGKPLSF